MSGNTLYVAVLVVLLLGNAVSGYRCFDKAQLAAASWQLLGGKQSRSQTNFFAAFAAIHVFTTGFVARAIVQVLA